MAAMFFPSPAKRSEAPCKTGNPHVNVRGLVYHLRSDRLSSLLSDRQPRLHFRGFLNEYRRTCACQPERKEIPALRPREYGDARVHLARDPAWPRPDDRSGG